MLTTTRQITAPIMLHYSTYRQMQQLLNYFRSGMDVRVNLESKREVLKAEYERLFPGWSVVWTDIKPGAVR